MYIYTKYMWELHSAPWAMKVQPYSANKSVKIEKSNNKYVQTSRKYTFFGRWKG